MRSVPEGLRSLLIGVPPSYPPPSDFPGWRVGCFLTPPSAEVLGIPAELETEIVAELGDGNEYIFDIADFRRAGYDVRARPGLPDDRAPVPVWVATRQGEALGLSSCCARSRPDRLHHVFWQNWDPSHPLYEAGNKYETAFQDYYRFLDVEVGRLLEVLPEDAITIVMSDHGARPMLGGFCFNDWLVARGLPRACGAALSRHADQGCGDRLGQNRRLG
jgi:predicted AlkP superfamily phosphohydrolase/phosphomutase